MEIEDEIDGNIGRIVWEMRTETEGRMNENRSHIGKEFMTGTEVKEKRMNNSPAEKSAIVIRSILGSG